MKIKHRFSFNTDEKHVIRFLDKHKINYDKNEFTTVCEMFEDTVNYCDGNKPEYYCEKGLVQKACFAQKKSLGGELAIS